MNPRYVRWQARLGRGDLHPGGQEASARAEAMLAPWAPGPILEVGAGAGFTAARLKHRGWDITALEPDDELRARCSAHGVRTLTGGIEALSGLLPEGSFRAVLAESVLFAFDLPVALGAIRTVLTPGGALCMNEMLWTEAADPTLAAEVARSSQEEFGIAVAPAQRHTWADWTRMLAEGGFELRLSEVSPRGGMTRPPNRLASLRRFLGAPIAAAQAWRADHLSTTARVPESWFESRIVLAVRI